MYYNEFEKIGIKANYGARGQGKVTCPKCLERKGGTRAKDLSVDYENGLYNCHASKCTFSGSVSKLKKYSRPVKRNETNLTNSAVSFFDGRGISQETLKKAGVTTDERGNIEFNYFNNDELINKKTRLVVDGKKTFRQHSGAEKILYNINSIKGKKKAIIVEGEIDVLSWMEAGLDNETGVISIDQGAGAVGSKLDGKLECIRNGAKLLSEVEEFYLCLDKDAPGQYVQEELIRRLGQQKCYIIGLPDGKNDSNDMLDKGKNPASHEANRQSLRECLKFAKPVPMDGIHELDDEMWEMMERQYNEGRAKGKTTHFPEIDEIFTFLPGDLTLVTGIPNHGKSQWARMLMVVKSNFDGWKWGCYVPEDFPLDYFYEDLCHIYLGITTDIEHKYRATPEQFAEAMLFVKEHFFCIYPERDKKTGIAPLPTNDWINERLTFLKLKYGINAVLKDPWNKIMHNIGNQREDQYLAQELSKEKFFASQFDCYFLVAHPSKLSKTGSGEYPCPSAYDLSGGAMWNNMMDNIMVVHRPAAEVSPTDTSVIIKTVKIKKKKVVGKTGAVNMMFDFKKARYYQDVDGFNPLEYVESAEPQIMARGDENNISF